MPLPEASATRLELLALVVAHVAMALAAFVDHGHYSLRGLGLLGLALAALAVAAWSATRPAPAASEPERPLVLGLLVLLLAGLTDEPGYDLRSAAYASAFFALQASLAMAVALAATRLRADRLWRALFAAAVVTGFALRVGIVFASPFPRIDVFTQFQEAAAHLWSGLDPYREPIAETPGAGSFGYRVVAYSYPPAALYPMALAWALLGDVRHAGIAAEALAVAALYRIARPAGPRVAQLLVLLLLFHPRGLYVIEQAWNEPLLVGAAAAFLYCAGRDPRSWRAPVSLGLFLSLKQYLVFFAFAALAARERRRWLLAVFSSALATWLPFLLWDAGSAIDNGLLFQLRTDFRPDGLTLPSLLHAAFGWTPTKWMAVAVGSAVAGLAQRAFAGHGLGGLLYVGLLATSFAFFFGTQAFCNYFYFLGALSLFLIALRLAAAVRGPR